MELKKLSTTQQKFIDFIAKSPLTSSFIFTGGTALSSAYLAHRFSEDLDFFSQEEQPLDLILGSFVRDKKQLGYSKIDVQIIANRKLLFFHFSNDEILKTEFTYYPFPSIEQGPKHYQLSIDSLKDIAANKLMTLAEKSRSRDYIDLYFILNHTNIQLRELYYLSKQKFDWHIDPIQLGTSFHSVETTDLSMVYDRSLTEEKLTEFFKEKAKEIEPNILKRS